MSYRDGFTAVELLVTLFVATLFVAGSYQLYSTIVKDSGDIRSRAKASNIAYMELRRHSESSSSICVETDAALSIPADHQLDNPSGTIRVICHLNGLKEVRANILYGPGPIDKQQEVKHAVYVAM